jgi:hypothetical protein
VVCIVVSEGIFWLVHDSAPGQVPGAGGSRPSPAPHIDTPHTQHTTPVCGPLIVTVLLGRFLKRFVPSREGSLFHSVARNSGPPHSPPVHHTNKCASTGQTHRCAPVFIDVIEICSYNNRCLAESGLEWAKFTVAITVGGGWDGNRLKGQIHGLHKHVTQ